MINRLVDLAVGFLWLHCLAIYFKNEKKHKSEAQYLALKIWKIITDHCMKTCRNQKMAIIVSPKQQKKYYYLCPPNHSK